MCLQVWLAYESMDLTDISVEEPETCSYILLMAWCSLVLAVNVFVLSGFTGFTTAMVSIVSAD